MVQRGGFKDLRVVVTKVKGERYEIKGLVKMMTRGRNALHGRRDDILREGEGNNDKIEELRFRLEEADTRCSRLTDDSEALRFKLRAKGGGVKVELRRALEAEPKRRGTIEAEARTGE